MAPSSAHATPGHTLLIYRRRRVFDQVHLGLDDTQASSIAANPFSIAGPRWTLARLVRGVLEFVCALDKERRGLPVAPEIEGDDDLIAELCESNPSGIRINLDRSKILDAVERDERYGLARLDGPCRPDASDELDRVIEENLRRLRRGRTTRALVMSARLRPRLRSSMAGSIQSRNIRSRSVAIPSGSRPPFRLGSLSPTIQPIIALDSGACQRATIRRSKDCSIPGVGSRAEFVRT
jgi:hypothetical protein